MQNLLKIEFNQNVSNVFTVKDNRRDVQIERIPLWLSMIDAFVGKTGERSLEFATSRPMKRHVTIVNQNDQPMLSLVFFDKRLTINSRFQIDNNGYISFNVNTQNSITEKVVCKIGMTNTDDYKVRVHWYGHKHIFQMHPTVGPILEDPLQPVRSQTQNVNVRVNAVVKLSDESARIEVEEAGNGSARPNVEDIMANAENRTFSLLFDLKNLDELSFEMSNQFKSLLRNTIMDGRQITNRTITNRKDDDRSDDDQSN